MIVTSEAESGYDVARATTINPRSPCKGRNTDLREPATERLKVARKVWIGIPLDVRLHEFGGDVIMVKVLLYPFVMGRMMMVMENGEISDRVLLGQVGAVGLAMSIARIALKCGIKTLMSHLTTDVMLREAASEPSRVENRHFVRYVKCHASLALSAPRDKVAPAPP